MSKYNLLEQDRTQKLIYKNYTKHNQRKLHMYTWETTKGEEHFA